MKSNYWILCKPVILVGLCLLRQDYAHSQIDEDVNVSKIAGNQKGHGKYTPYIPDVKHPVSTFFSEYDVNEISNILKWEIKERKNNDNDYYSFYKTIYESALSYVNGTTQLYLPGDYDEPGQSDPNALAAKRAAFVCLMGIDQEGQAFNSAFAPIEDYITERYKEGGQTYYTENEELRRHGFATQLKAKAFVLLSATNLAGSRLVYAPMPVTLGMKRFHPILPSTRANYFQDMFTTYPTTSR